MQKVLIEKAYIFFSSSVFYEQMTFTGLNVVVLKKIGCDCEWSIVDCFIFHSKISRRLLFQVYLFLK